MGFFSSLVKAGVGAIGGAIRGFTGAAAPTARLLTRAAPIVTRSPLARVGLGLGSALAAGGAFAVGDVALSSLLDGPDDGTPLAATGGAGVGGGCPGGASGNIVTTLIVTRNAAGQIICTKRRRGSPHLMNSDLIIAKRVRRVASSLANKLVPRTRKQSKAAKLTEAVQDAVMRRVSQDAACPTT